MQLGGPVIFCETFDAPAGIGNRSGDLNGNVWGVSRAMGSSVNFGQSDYNLWNSTLLQKCDGTTPRVVAPHDIIICNGQLREAVNDNNSGAFDAGDVSSLAMYPKQPFDFAGRTGTVSFDVSNDTAGSHAAWPEFWLSDLPVPDPFQPLRLLAVIARQRARNSTRCGVADRSVGYLPQRQQSGQIPLDGRLGRGGA